MRSERMEDGGVKMEEALPASAIAIVEGRAK